MKWISAAVAASEAGERGGQVSPYVFGLFAFLVLGALLVVTMMINVDR
jgi:hypothetical protein